MALLVVGLSIGIPSLAGASPRTDPNPAAAPSIPSTTSTPTTTASVQQQLAALTVRNAQLVEQYNQAVINLAARQREADLAEAAARRADDAYASGRQSFAAAMTAQYETGSFSTTGALLSSQNGQSYLDQLQTLNMISAQQGETVAALASEQRAAADARQRANGVAAAAAATRAALAAQKQAVSTQVTRFATLLATLDAAQQAAVLAKTSPVATQAAAESAVTQALAGPSTPGLVAVRFALAQLGKWYVWGSAGPSTFDCSGLTMRAWQSAGVSLPHSAADQYNYGTHVAADAADLKPGDLIFFYEPIGHVTIYLGNGLMISAPETGEQVSIVPLANFASDIAGATRLG